MEPLPLKKMKNLLSKTKDLFSTIALVVSFFAVILSAFSNGIPELGGGLIGMLGFVLLAEYFSIKHTDKTISKRFGDKSDKVKYGMSSLFVLWAISLLVHLNI